MPRRQKDSFDNIIGRLRFVLPPELKKMTNKEFYELLDVHEHTFLHWQANKAYPDSDSMERLYDLMVEWKVNPNLQIWVVRKRGGPPPAITYLEPTGEGTGR